MNVNVNVQAQNLLLNFFFASSFLAPFLWVPFIRLFSIFGWETARLVSRVPDIRDTFLQHPCRRGLGGNIVTTERVCGDGSFAKHRSYRH